MQKKVAQWKEAAHGVSQIDPNYFSDFCDKVREIYGKLTPALILEETKKLKKSDSLYKYLEWDDKKAADSWRKEQIKYLIRKLEITVVHKNEKRSTRKYVSVGRGVGDNKESEYHDIRGVVKDSSLTDQVVRRAWNELLSWKHRYEHLTEFIQVCTVIEEEQKKQVANI